MNEDFDLYEITAFGDTERRYVSIPRSPDLDATSYESAMRVAWQILDYHRQKSSDIEKKLNHLDLGNQQKWLDEGYTDLFEQESQLWGFPPNGVMPVPLAKLFKKDVYSYDDTEVQLSIPTIGYAMPGTVTPFGRLTRPVWPGQNTIFVES